MKWVVCGGREYFNRENIYASLYTINQYYPCKLLIEGGARGPDTISGEWANGNKINHLRVPAQWDFYGSSAGSVRNMEMLCFMGIIDLRPDIVIAFPGNRGTQDMQNKSWLMDVPVLIVSDVGVIERIDP